MSKQSGTSGILVVLVILVVLLIVWIAGMLRSRPEIAVVPATPVEITAAAAEEIPGGIKKQDDILKIEQLESEIDSLRKALDAANRRLEIERAAQDVGLREEVNELRLRLDQQETLVREATSQKDQAIAKVAEIETTLKTLDTEKDLLRKRIAALEESLNKAAQQTEGVRRELAEAEKQNAEFQERIRVLEERTAAPEVKE